MKSERDLLGKIRFWTVFYILALVVSGVTAFPMEWEMGIMGRLLSIDPSVSPDIYGGYKQWLATVYQGIIQTNASFPFITYGTDWLAFSHLVIAVAFIGVYVKPVRNIWIVYWAMIACVAVIPLALIGGAIREIPVWWRLIDCSFGVFGILPLLLLRKYILQLQKLLYIPDCRY